MQANPLRTGNLSLFQVEFPQRVIPILLQYLEAMVGIKVSRRGIFPSQQKPSSQPLGSVFAGMFSKKG